MCNHVCVLASVYVYVPVLMSVHARSHACVRVWTHACVCVHTNAYSRACGHNARPCVSVHFMRMFVCVCVHISEHVRMFVNV